MDRDAINLAKAIRKAETGTSTDPYNAKGASGEYGAYQFMPDTWKQWSKQYLGEENAPLTVANQNKVAYSRIKELKEQGLTPAQIASSWNSGSPTAYKEGKTGVNSMGVAYDVPTYVSKVSQNYRIIKNQNQPEVQKNTIQSSQQGYDIPEVPETREQKIARINQENVGFNADLKKNTGLGFVKNFGKELISNLAPSEVGLGKSIAQIVTANNKPLQQAQMESSNIRLELAKRIQEKEARGEDATKLKQAFNSIPAEATQGELPTTGKVLGQLGGTALDLLTVGTYSKAKSAIPTVVTGARKTTGLFTLPAVKKVATGTGIGYGFDVTQGLQGERGEERTGGKAFIPGLGTAIGAAIPATLEAEQSVKNIFNKDTRTQNLINKRTKELSNIVDNNASLRKKMERSTEKGFNVVEDIANTDLLANSVDNTGTIRTTQSIDELNQIIKPAEDVIKKNLEKEGKKVSLKFVEKKLTDSVMNSDLEGKALTRALKNIQQEIAGYARRADADGYISLAKVHDAKVNKYATINYMNPTTGKGDKVIAKALKELVENQSKSVDVKKVNRELSRFYNMQSFLESLDGKKVKGGKLGKYFAQTVGGLIGSHFGPIGTLVGANISGRVQGAALARTLSGKTGTMPIRSQVLEDAIQTGKPNPTILLPQNTAKMADTTNPTNIRNAIAADQAIPNIVNTRGLSDTNVPITNNNAIKPNINSNIPPQSNIPAKKSSGLINTKEKGITEIKASIDRAIKKNGSGLNNIADEGDFFRVTFKNGESPLMISKKFIEKNYGDIKLADITTKSKLQQFSDKIKNTPNKQGGFIKLPIKQIKTDLPSDDLFKSAVKNTEGAEITADGLKIKGLRFQKPEQAGEQSIRTGVFYLPEEKSANAKFYKGSYGYGGSEKMTGDILVQKPLFVKGTTGGKAPELAYDILEGKGAYQKMRSDVLDNVVGYNKRDYEIEEGIYSLFNKYGGDESVIYDLMQNSKEGNLLPYAVQEHIVANAVREAGYDSVLGYSKKKTGEPFLSELFDIRENTYPAGSNQAGELNPKFDYLPKQQKTNLGEQSVSQAKSSLPKNNTDLITEAKKYKSAEEFVKGQPTVFKGTGGTNEFQNKQGSVAVGTHYALDKNRASAFGEVTESAINPEAKIIRIDMTGRELDDIAKELGVSERALLFPEMLTKELKELGYDGIIKTDRLTKTKESVTDLVDFTGNSIKTKSQLEQIWKEANKK